MVPLPVAPQSAPAMHLSTTLRGASLVLCLFLPNLVGVCEFALAQADCFSGCPHHGPDLFAHILTPPTLQLDLGNSVQCHVFIILSSVDGPLSWFDFFFVISRAPIKMHVLVCLCQDIQSFMHILRTGRARTYDNSIFIFWRSLYIDFHVL